MIEVERINLVEHDGTLRMVLANSALAPDPVVDGQVLKRESGKDAAGTVFYNEHGDECGGLVFSGQQREGGYSAGAALLFDQFKQDQVIGIMHEDSDGGRRAGLWVWTVRTSRTRPPSQPAASLDTASSTRREGSAKFGTERPYRTMTSSPTGERAAPHDNAPRLVHLVRAVPYDRASMSIAPSLNAGSKMRLRMAG